MQFESVFPQSETFDPFRHICAFQTRLAHSCQIAFHIRQENRNAAIAEGFRHNL